MKKLLILIAFVSAAFLSHAQFGSLYVVPVDTFTLDSSETSTYVISRSTTFSDQYQFYGQLFTTQTSGNNSANMFVDVSYAESGDYWQPIDTVAMDTLAENLSFNFDSTALRARLRFISTGDSSSDKKLVRTYLVGWRRRIE